MKSECRSHQQSGGNGELLLSHEEIAEMWGVSRTRVWQIEQRALCKIRKYIEREAKLAGVSPIVWLMGEEETD